MKCDVEKFDLARCSFYLSPLTPSFLQSKTHECFQFTLESLLELVLCLVDSTDFMAFKHSIKVEWFEWIRFIILQLALDSFVMNS